MNARLTRSNAAARKEGAENGRAHAGLKHKLKSLHDGDLAVVEAVALGAPAIPVLRELLFETDCAGIFAPRQRAVQALVALGAHDVLSEFVAGFTAGVDPVQRIGDEASLGTAARALGAAKDPKFFPVLLAAARKHAVAGVIEALGEYRCSQAIAILAEALGDDLKRSAAQEALEKLGQGALPALLEIALRGAAGPSGRETPSGVRRRRSALELLLKLKLYASVWETLCGLADDADEETATLACRIGMAAADEAGKRACAHKLISLLEGAPWFSRQEMEDCLSENFAFAADIVERALGEAGDAAACDRTRANFIRSLKRIKARASAGPTPVRSQ